MDRLGRDDHQPGRGARVVLKRVEATIETRARHELHAEIGQAATFADFVDRDDVRVIELATASASSRNRRNSFSEANSADLITFTATSRPSAVGGRKNDPHPATAKLAEHFVSRVS